MTDSLIHFWKRSCCRRRLKPNWTNLLALLDNDVVGSIHPLDLLEKYASISCGWMSIWWSHAKAQMDWSMLGPVVLMPLTHLVFGFSFACWAYSLNPTYSAHQFETVLPIIKKNKVWLMLKVWFFNLKSKKKRGISHKRKMAQIYNSVTQID